MATQKELLEERIKAEKQKLAKMLEKYKEIESASKTLENKKRRQRETRQKILIGAFVLDVLQKNGVSPLMLQLEGWRLNDFLTSPTDRALFGLPSLDEAKAPQRT